MNLFDTVFGANYWSKELEKESRYFWKNILYLKKAWESTNQTFRESKITNKQEVQLSNWLKSCGLSLVFIAFIFLELNKKKKKIEKYETRISKESKVLREFTF